MKNPFRSLGRNVAFQTAVAVAVGLVATTVGEWMTWPSKAISILRKLEFTDNEISWAVALVDLGNVISPIPSSYLMDCIGRKTVLYIIGVLYFLINVLFFASNDIWLIYIARLFDGIGKGIIYVVLPIYLTEIANVRIRGALSSIIMSSQSLGMFYGYLFGWLLTYTGLIIAYVIIPILFIITYVFVPESPYYLIMKKKEKEALKTFAKFRQLHIDSEVLLQEYDILKSTVSKDMANKNRFCDLVGTNANRRAIFIVSLLAIFQRTAGISPTLTYMTVTLPKNGGGASIEVYMIIFSLTLVIATNAAMLLIDIFGRKTLLLCSSIGTAIVQAATGTFFLLQESGYDVESWNWVPYACLVIFGITYCLGLSFIPSTLVGELFPMNVKSYAGSISSIFLAATSFCINKVFLLYPVQYLYYFFSFSCLVSTGFCVFFVFETKGKTFSKIQEKLQKLSEK